MIFLEKCSKEDASLRGLVLKQKSKINSAYDAISKNFSKRAETNSYNAYVDQPAIFSLLPGLDRKKVLDAGCGPGIYTEKLVALGARVVAFDSSPKMVDLAREKLKNKAEIRLQDLTEPLSGLSNSDFDLVLCALVLDHIENWNFVFEEFFRVLKPGGQVVFSAGHPFWEADYFGTENYHSIEPVESVWRGFGRPVKMPSFRRPLKEFFMPLILAGFQIEKILEPLPSEKLKEIDPRRFEKLLKRPVFLAVRAVKPK